MEALIVANAAFEVALAEALVGAVAANDRAVEVLNLKRHRYRLELLEKIVVAETETGLITAEFEEFLSVLRESNSMRNAYLHQLVVPTDNFWKLAELDRKVERVLPFITDPYRCMITMGRLFALAKTSRDLILAELQKLKDWTG